MFLIPTIWIIIGGGVVEDTFIDIAFATLRLALLLRTIHLLLVVTSLILVLSLISFLILGLKKKVAGTITFDSQRWFVFRLALGLYLGYMLGEILFYFLLNGIFFRNVFVTIPFFLGSALFIGVLGLVFGNLELTPRIIGLLNSETSNSEKSISKLRLLENVGKVVLFLFLALIFIIPNVGPLFGTLPTPPGDPAEPYINDSELFGYKIIKLEHILPSNISEMIESENSDGKWYTYIYLPDIGPASNLQFPVALYLHGYTGIDVNLYHSSMKALAQRGAISIFTQYATFINLNDDLEDVKFDHPAGNPELYVRYTMEWSGIIQAVNALNLDTNSIGAQTLVASLGNNYTIDYSRLMIIGHSMGGGMVPYVATKSLEQGWGSNELILDMEAPWYSSTWSGYQPNYNVLPSHTLLNVGTYEDDHSVSQCIGMDFYEKIRLSNGTLISDSQLNFIYLYSDFHGFPRLLASHYVPIDPIDDQLHQYGYKKRINAMAFYLFETAQGRTGELVVAREYFLGSEVTNMGSWSDGEPVNAAYSTRDPYGIRSEASLVPKLQDSSEPLCAVS